MELEQDIPGSAPDLTSGADTEHELRSLNAQLREQAAQLRRLNQELRDREQRLRLAIETGRIGLWVWNSTDVANSGDWSPRLKEIFSKPPQVEVTHELFLRCVHPDDRQRVNAAVMGALAGDNGGTYQAEYRTINQQDGSLHWVTARAQAFFDADGRPFRFIGTLMEITERKMFEEVTLRMNQELERRIAERTADLERAMEDRRLSERLARGQLSALARTLDSLAQESDPDELPRHVVTTIASQLRAHSVAIWQRAGDTLEVLGIFEDGGFHTRHHPGPPPGSLPVVGPAPPLWAEALRSGENLLIEDLPADEMRILLGDGRAALWQRRDLTPAFAALRDRMVPKGVRGLLIAPLILGGQLEGIISIRFTGDQTFTAQDIALVKALAHQSMLAVQLMRLSRQSREAAVAAERNRLAQEIHDTLAQGLTGIIVQLEAAEDAQSRGLHAEASQHMSRAGRLARESLHEARASVHALRPRVLTQLHLCSALKQLLEKTTQGTNLAAEFVLEGEPQRLPETWEQNLLRMVQEGLANTLRHAQATRFQVRLIFAVPEVRLELVDNGRGFDVATAEPGLGLRGLHERAESMGGRLEVASSPGGGTRIRAILPTIGVSNRIA